MPSLKSIKTLLGVVLLGVVGAWMGCSDSAPVASQSAGKAACALCEFLGDETYTAADGVAAPEAPDTTQTQAEADSTQADADADADADSTQTDAIEFADANLERAVREALDRPSGPLTAADLATLTVLNANDRGIQSLAGLEHATALQELYLRSNEITDVSPLASLTNLQRLSLWGNEVEDISPLASLTNLQRLSLWGNEVVDVSPLASLTKLYWLQLGDNSIADITPLASLTKLRWLSVVNNALSQHAAEQQLADLVASDLSVQAQRETIQTEPFVFPEPESGPPVIPMVPVLYWVDNEDDRIRRTNADDRRVEVLITSGINQPFDLALDVANRKMYWPDVALSTIKRANMDGGNSSVENVVTGRGAWSVALDVARGKMYWTEYGTSSIQRADMDGGVNSNRETVIAGLSSNPRFIALDVANRKMYWTTNGDGIKRANMDGGSSSVENVVTVDSPWHLALDVANRKVYWAESGVNWIKRANMDGTDSNVETFLTNLPSGAAGPRGLKVDLANRKIYWGGFTAQSNTIWRADIDGGVNPLTEAIISGPQKLTGLALELVPK